MPEKKRRAGVCPGPGDNRRCVSSGHGTPRGGRCRACRLAAMRIWGAKTRGRNAKKAMHGGRRKPGSAASKYAQTLAAEIAAARAVKADHIGIPGALRLINEKLRTA